MSLSGKKIRAALSAAAAAVCLCCAAVVPVTAGAGENYYAQCQDMLAQINSYRSQNGLAPVELNLTLSDTACLRAQETVSVFEHNRPNGTKFNTAIDEFNLTYYEAYENIAYGFTSPKDVMAAWINSSGHRSNILNANVKNVGVGIYGTYWVQLFTGEMTGDGSKGDVNYDGKITAADAASVLRFYSVKSVYDSFNEIDDYLTAADYNGDGAVTAVDASFILAKYAQDSTS